MSQSVLLTIARKSIEEVLRAEQSIDRPTLIEQYPLLTQTMATRLTLYLNDEIRGESTTEHPTRSLLEDIIYNAKIAAFQDERFLPLVTSEYLRCSLELTLFTPEGELSHRDKPMIGGVEHSPFHNDRI